MVIPDIIALRLQNQLINQSGFKTPAELVKDPKVRTAIQNSMNELAKVK